MEQIKKENEEEYKKVKLAIEDSYEQLETLYLQLELQEKEKNIRKENLRIETLKYERRLSSSYDYLKTLTEYVESATVYYKMEKNYILLEESYKNLVNRGDQQ